MGGKRLKSIIAAPANVQTQPSEGMTPKLGGVTFHAWRLGDEKRDVALLGVFGGPCGAGTVVSSIL